MHKSTLNSKTPTSFVECVNVCSGSGCFRGLAGVVSPHYRWKEAAQHPASKASKEGGVMRVPDDSSGPALVIGLWQNRDVLQLPNQEVSA